MLKDLFKGIVIGIGNILPGVSGGTLAIALNIFDELIFAINNIFKDFKNQFIFLMPILIGAVLGIGLFSIILEYSLRYFSFPSATFFVGLILGTVPLIWSKASSQGFKPIYLAYTVISLIIVVVITNVSPLHNQSSEFTITYGIMIQSLICGILASAAMIIPGLSGSFVMLLLGMYYPVLTAISDFITSFLSWDFQAMIPPILLLAPLAIGIIIGTVLVSKLLTNLLERAYGATYYSILGLTLGSIYSIFADPATYTAGVTMISIVAAIATGIIGAVLAIKLCSDN